MFTISLSQNQLNNLRLLIIAAAKAPTTGEEGVLAAAELIPILVQASQVKVENVA